MLFKFQKYIIPHYLYWILLSLRCSNDGSYVQMKPLR